MFTRTPFCTKFVVCFEIYLMFEKINKYILYVSH